MDPSLKQIIDSYDATAPLEEASTIPSSWYVDSRLLDLEMKTVFARSWQLAGRVEQVSNPGQYITSDVAGEPVVIIRGNDMVLRGFFNVCRHHASAVMTECSGHAVHLRCPYHGWTYSLEGQLKSTPDFGGGRNLDRTSMGLVPVETAVWEKWVLVKLDRGSRSLEDHVGEGVIGQLRSMNLGSLHWFERRSYLLDSNWKVFVDNYLDGGYHVPLLHKGLASVLDYSQYTIETGAHHCVQSSPVIPATKDAREQEVGAVRTGDRALYYWIYPNLMINHYEGVMDTNLVIPRGVDRTEVVFDFYFTDIADEARARNLASIAVAEKIQNEDAAICNSVQHGLNSRAYTAGRLSVRREAGTHLFHKLLHSDLQGSEE